MRTIFCLSLLLGACAAQMQQANPVPNVLLPTSSRSLSVELAPSIPEDFVALSFLKVSGWHETLTRGFHNGFDRFFAPSGQPGDKLVVLRADAELTNVASARADLNSYQAAIRYQAELVGPDGTVVARFADTGKSDPQSIGSDRTIIFSRAVENMYEQIAKQLSSRP